MKNVFTLLACALAVAASAQSVSTSVSFKKAQKPALMLYLPYSEEVAEGTILTKLKETGFTPETTGSLFWKNSKVDGWHLFKGINLRSEHHGSAHHSTDLYFKVDRRGSRKDSQSVVYLLAAKEGENFVSAGSDAATHAAAQHFLNGFVTETAKHNHTLNIKAQEELVMKTEKKLANLKGDEADLNKKLAKLQEDIKRNQQEQVNQQATIEAEKKKLEDMKVVKQ